MIRKLKVLLASTGAFIALSSSGFCLVTATLTDTDAPFSSISINPGQSFTLTLSVTSTIEQLQSVDYFLTISTTGSTFFSIVGRDISGSVFTDTFATNTAYLNASSSLLDPTNNTNGGATIIDPNTPPTAGGPFKVADLTISSSALLTEGIYFLSLINSEVSFGDPLAPDTQSISASYTINVIPEPTTFTLLGLGSLAVLGSRRRKSGLK